MTVEVHEAEQRSLKPALWANLFMGAAGVTAALMSNASALMLDGLFSAVNFSAALIAAKVARSIQRKPALMRPFGYEIDEPVYVMFRSLVLIGLILMASFVACNKIFRYVTVGEAAPVRLDWIVGYMALMIVICVSLALWHHRNWISTGRRSNLLKTEKSAAVIDAALSGAAGIAFLVISLLQGTKLNFLVPVSDSIVVLGLSAYMVSGPIGMFIRALKEVVGEAADDSIQDRLRESLTSEINPRAFKLLESTATPVGRSLFAVAYLEPLRPMGAAELDRARDVLLLSCQRAFAMPLRMEFVFTARRPFESPSEEAHASESGEGDSGGSDSEGGDSGGSDSGDTVRVSD
ncbi:MAG: cation transporter [Rubripirellula sp.]